VGFDGGFSQQQRAMAESGAQRPLVQISFLTTEFWSTRSCAEAMQCFDCTF
jgi:hypothetical protein